MKTKIFNGLKQAYSNLGLSEEIIQGHADALAATGFVTDENLATVIQGQKPFLTSLQSGIDKRVTDAVAKAKGEQVPPIPPVLPTPPASGLTAEDVAKIVAEQMKPFADTVSTFQTQTAAEKRSAEVASKAKEFGIPNSWLRDRNIPSGTDLDEYFKGVKQDLVNDGFALNQPPETSEQRIAKESESIAAMIGVGTKEIIDNQKK